MMKSGKGEEKDDVARGKALIGVLQQALINYLRTDKGVKEDRLTYTKDESGVITATLKDLEKEPGFWGKRKEASIQKRFGQLEELGRKAELGEQRLLNEPVPFFLSTVNDSTLRKELFDGLVLHYEINPQVWSAAPERLARTRAGLNPDSVWPMASASELKNAEVPALMKLIDNKVNPKEEKLGHRATLSKTSQE